MGGGGGSLLSGGGDPLKALKKLADPREVKEAAAFGLDPGGLMYTSKDEDIAALQAQLDVGAIGSKATVSTRESEKRMQQQVAEAKKAADKERRMVEAQEGIEAERKRRMEKRRASRIERGSLLYGMDGGTKETLGG